MLEKELKIVETFKQLVTRQVKVHEVRVFGSRARGDATEYSDLDVLVVVDQLDHKTGIFEKDFSKVLHRTFELRQKADYMERTEVTKQDIDEIQPEVFYGLERPHYY